MKINLSPIRHDSPLTLSREQDALIINGERFDFSPLEEGATLPASAISTEWIPRPVTREEGEITLTLNLPHSRNAPEATRFPEPIMPTDGPVALPLFGFEVDEDGNEQEVHAEQPEKETEGAIDWTQMQTAAEKAAARLVEWREGASLSRAKFASVAAKAQMITDEEAEEWAAGASIPQWVSDAIEAAVVAGYIPEDERLDVRIAARTQSTIGRMGKLIPILAEAKDLTPEQVDALFGWKG